MTKRTTSWTKPLLQTPTPSGRAQKQWDVFLSYSNRNSAIAARIASDLRTAGLTVWHDVTNVRPGERVRDAIGHGIRHSKVFVLLASVHSLRSRWVLNELDAAMLNEISESRAFVMPVLIGKIEPESLPSDVVGKHYIDLRHNFGNRYQAKGAYLIQSVGLLARQTTDPQPGSLLLVPDFLNKVLAHHYDGARELNADVRARIPAFAFGCIKDAWELTKDGTRKGRKKRTQQLGIDIFDHKRCRDAFLRRYGEFALQQLALYVVDELRLSFSGGCSYDDFRSFINISNILLGMFSLRDFLVAEQGLDLAVVRMGPTKQGFMVIGRDA